MIKKYLTILLLIIGLHNVFSQGIMQLSVYSEVSVITIGPGEELYEKFGHSSIRIKDPVLNLDLVYDYGIFDFNAPNFYSNFTKGKLLYKVARYPFHYVLSSKKEQKRWVKQQVLNLNQQERQQLFLFLERNVLPKNATYLYDPFFDNCATKIIDNLITVFGNKVSFSSSHLTNKSTLRKLMNIEIHWNTWGSLGINLALGNKLDKTLNANQYNYLPDYVYLTIKNARIHGNNLISKERILLDYKEKENAFSFTGPFFIFLLLSLIGLLITYRDYKNNLRSKSLDFIVFFFTGLIGILVIFLWFFTNHSTTPNNFNFLWAFAPNLIVSFFLLKSEIPKWLKKYNYFILILLITIPLVWLTGVQEFSFALIPLLILLVIRYYYLLTFKK